MKFIEDELLRIIQSTPNSAIEVQTRRAKIKVLKWVLEKLKEPAIIHDMEEPNVQASWNVIDRNEFEQLKRQHANQIADLDVKLESLQNNFNKLLTEVDKSFGSLLEGVMKSVEELEQDVRQSKQ